jgi:hypothetical protein
MIRSIGRKSAAIFAGCFSAWLGAAGALAQDIPPGCVASQNPNGAVVGAVVGGLAGGLLGNALSGRHKAKGTILGAAGGAVAGAAVGNAAGQGNPCPQGYDYRGPPPRAAAAYEEPPPPSAERGEFWYGAPPRIHDRIAFLRRRIAMLDHDGWLSPREREGLFHRLGEIERREEDVRARNDGHIPPEVRDHFTDDLNEVARRLRWEQYTAEHPDN